MQDDRKGIAGDEAGGVGSDWDMEDSELDPWDPSKGFTQECDMAGLAMSFGKIVWDEWGGCKCRGKGSSEEAVAVG